MLVAVLGFWWLQWQSAPAVQSADRPHAAAEVERGNAPPLAADTGRGSADPSGHAVAALAPPRPKPGH